MKAAFDRADAFAARFGLTLPILLAPMAGSCPPSLSIAVAGAGGMGACGALRMTPGEIMEWAQEFRSGGNEAFQMNLWIPDPAPVRDAARETRLRTFLADWGPAVPETVNDAEPLDFAAQCDALIACGTPVVSSIMGIYPAPYVQHLKQSGIAWFATATTVAEARAAAAAGADVIVAQGSEAGGHRGSFDPGDAERQLVGLFALLPAIVDAVDVPVVATGGIGDARGIVAALALGASAVQIGTGFLRCPEAKLHPAWADALGRAMPEDTTVTRAFTGRAARGIANRYVIAANGADAPMPMAYPLHRELTDPLRADAARQADRERMQLWSGQAAAMAKPVPAAELARDLWEQARAEL
jgi:nitronate monooxygenase